MTKTLHCMHQEDWMCQNCCKCGLCCDCQNPGELVHINSRAAQEAWRRTINEISLPGVVPE